jgi:hypothetical protein
VNLGTIVKYAATLFAVQFVVGFLQGASFASTIWSLAGSSLASLLACTAVFAHLFIRQANRPLAHAWLTLLLLVGVSILLSCALAPWLGSTPFVLVLLEWVVVAGALVAGSLVDSKLRSKRRVPADA